MRIIYIIALTFFTSLYSQEELPKPQHFFYGKHYIASFHMCHPGTLEDDELLFATFMGAIYKSSANVLDFCTYHFKNGGFTGVVLLSESHASIHTYPEYGACFVDFFTCGDSCEFKEFVGQMKGYLKPLRTNEQLVERQ